MRSQTEGIPRTNIETQDENALGLSSDLYCTLPFYLHIRLKADKYFPQKFKEGFCLTYSCVLTLSIMPGPAQFRFMFNRLSSELPCITGY